MQRKPVDALKRATGNFEFFDTGIFLYLSVFVREYFWIVRSNTLAWILTIVVSLFVFAVYLHWKEPVKEKLPVVYWVLVGVPLFIVYALRFAYPDLSFDVLNYHIFHSERALRGLLYIPGDFAPAYFPFLNNPAPDMITGIFRHLLGFRLGTVVNYFALLWSGAILFRFLRSYVAKDWLASAVVLAILFSEELLFEINNYMVDLLALPLLLNATVLAIDRVEASTRARKQLAIIALLLGMSTALKLTNLVFVLPIGLVALYSLAAAKLRGLQAFRILLTALVAFVLPVFPYSFYVYSLTGNPTFPLFNKIFKSPLWPIENVFDGRWGPKGVVETVVWPLKIWVVPERLTELNVYGGRISLGVLAACLLLFFGRRDYRLRSLALLTIAGAVLWSAGTGYIRYGLFLEVLGGMTLATLASSLWNSDQVPAIRFASIAVWCVLLVQTLHGATYVLKTEWGGRSIARRFGREARNIFSDRSLTQFLNQEESRTFDGVEAWIESTYKTSAIAVMLRNDIPSVNIFVDAFFSTPLAFKNHQAALRTVAQKKMLSLAWQEDLDMALSTLDKRGFTVLKSTPLEFPYYSLKNRLRLVVMEVALKPSAQPEGIFDAQIQVLQGLTRIKAGEAATIRVKVRNSSGGVWSANGQPPGSHQVKLGNKWLDTKGNIIVNDDGRTALTRDVKPGEEVELELHVKGPENPGSYVLMIDLVQENVAWFSERGSATANLLIVVERR
jgi:hypothetical protein